ncbi:MAG: hypothetical protein Q7S22_06855 [Candidatus Micrarchaeota archaeon]|nr:hypothetical protein [Candidatus Micrarchaeota archaeon]
MSLAFRNNQPSNFKKYALAPFRLAGRGYLLADDFIYRRVDEVAKATEFVSDKVTGGRFAATRKQLMYGTLVAGHTLPWLVHQLTVGPSKIVLPVLPIFIAPLVGVIQNAKAGSNNSSTPVENLHSIILMSLRTPLFVVGLVEAFITIKYGEKTILHSFSDHSYLALRHPDFAIAFMLDSISFYLALGSNGMTDKLKDWAKQKWEEIKMGFAKPVPVTEPKS